VTTSGTLTVSGTLALTNGGTGANTAAAARTNLGLAIGTTVQAQSANLQAVANLTTAADQIDYWTGSGTAAVTALSSWARSTVLSQTTNGAFLTAVGAAPLVSPTLTTPTFSGVTTVNGFAYFNVNSQTRPVASSVPGSLSQGSARSWNFSGGNGEVCEWNLFTGASNSFSFKQMTSATTHTDLLDLSNTAATFRVPIRSVGLGANLTPRGRLVLGPLLPATPTDPLGQSTVTNSPNLYYMPCDGDVIPLWDGGMWVPRTFTLTSIPINALAAGTAYDVFMFWNGSAVAAETVAWAAGTAYGPSTNTPNTFATARATALVYQNGILVKSGDATRRYVGSFHTQTGTTAGNTVTSDDFTRRLVFNYYNQVTKTFQRDGAADGPYTIPAANAWYPHVSKLNFCVYYFGGVNGSLSLNSAIAWNPTTANAPNVAYIGLMDQIGNVPAISAGNTGSIANQFSGASVSYQRGQVNGLIAFDPAVLAGGINVQFRNSKLHGVCQC
jgi:hypothetical protein